MGALPRTPDYLVCRAFVFILRSFVSRFFAFFFYGAGGMPFSLSNVLKINQNVLFFFCFVLFFYFIIFFFFPFLCRAHEQFGYCQAGTSGMLLDDDTALIGTPGPYTWRGTMFAVSVSDDFLHRDKTLYYGPLTQDHSPVDKYSYLGMAIFFSSFLLYFNTDVAHKMEAKKQSLAPSVQLFDVMSPAVI